MRRLLRALVVVAIVVALVAFAGGRLAAPVARDRLLAALRKTFSTEVSVEDVSFDILSLRVNVTGLRIADAPGFGSEPMIEIPSASGALDSIASAFGTPSVSADVAPGAVVRLAFAVDGTLNLDAARVKAPPSTSPVHLELHAIQVRNARVTLLDRTADGAATTFELEGFDVALHDLVVGGRSQHDADLRVRGWLRAADGERAPLVLAAAIARPPDAAQSMRARFEAVGLDLGPLRERGTELRTLIGGRFVDLGVDLVLADQRLDVRADTLSSGGEKMHVAITGPVTSPTIEDPHGLLARVPAEKLRRLGRAGLSAAGAVVEGGERAIETVGELGVAAVDTTTDTVESVVGGARDAAKEVGELATKPAEIPGAVAGAVESVGKGAFDLLKGTVEKGKDLVTGTAETAQQVVTKTVKDVFLETPGEAQARRAAQVASFVVAVRRALEFRAAIAREQGDVACAARIERELADDGSGD